MVKSKKQNTSDATETVAQRAAMDAFLKTFVSTLKGTSIEGLLGTQHEHVAVMRLSTGHGLAVHVAVRFESRLKTPLEVELLSRFKPT